MRALGRRPWFAVPLLVFAATRLADAVVIALLARHQVPVASVLHTGPVPTLVDPPSYLSAIQSWDGQWYRHIVEHGYPATLPRLDGQVAQNAWAFYPGYPAIVWLVMRLGLGFGVAASLVSLLAGAGAMCVLYRLVLERGSSWLAGVTVLAVCSAPAAPALQAAYTESLGLLLLLLALWCLERRRYGWLAACGLALALTRPITAPLALVALVELVRRWRGRGRDPFPVSQRWVLAGSTVVLAVSAVIWPLVTGVVTGDLSAYAQTQRAWRWGSQHRGGTWLGSLVHGAPAARWVFVLVVLVAVVAIAVWNRVWSPGVRAWMVAYPLYLFAATPPTSSIFRYLLLLGPGWWPFSRLGGGGAASGVEPGASGAAAGEGTLSRRQRTAIVVAVAVLGLASQVLWLTWYFVITPANRGTP